MTDCDCRTLIDRLPSRSKAYVFGSCLRSGQPPADIDLLIVYDPEVCPPEKTYDLHAPFINTARSTFDLPVDFTLLTFKEERDSRFVEDTSAISLHVLWPNL